MNKIEKLQEIIDASDNIVFFGGAGVSTESGIPDFRSESGIFKSLEKYGDTPERLVSHSYYLEHTDKFFSYYKDCLIFPEAEPNPAHYTLARLEKEGKVKSIITQNIDGLHQKAGSKNVLELHGIVYRNYCEICKKEYDLNFILESEGIPHCTCGGIIKPDVVLYEEALDMIIPKYVTSLIYGGMIEAVASENGARMQAMDSATSNAEDMISSLSLLYNRARQGSITQELTEIIAGANAIS